MRWNLGLVMSQYICNSRLWVQVTYLSFCGGLFYFIPNDRVHDLRCHDLPRLSLRNLPISLHICWYVEVNSGFHRPYLCCVGEEHIHIRILMLSTSGMFVWFFIFVLQIIQHNFWYSYFSGVHRCLHSCTYQIRRIHHLWVMSAQNFLSLKINYFI